MSAIRSRSVWEPVVASASCPQAGQCSPCSHMHDANAAPPVQLHPSEPSQFEHIAHLPLQWVWVNATNRAWIRKCAVQYQAQQRTTARAYTDASRSHLSACIETRASVRRFRAPRFARHCDRERGSTHLSPSGASSPPRNSPGASHQCAPALRYALAIANALCASWHSLPPRHGRGDEPSSVRTPNARASSAPIPRRWLPIPMK